MKRYFSILIVFTAVALLFCMVPTQAHAIVFWGAKSMGMGSATVAIADDNHALEINPGGIAQGGSYSIDASYERKEYEVFDYPHLHPDLTAEVDQNDFFGGEVFGTETETVNRNKKFVVDSWRISIVDSATVPNFSMGFYATGTNLTSKAFTEGLGYDFGLAIAGNIADIVYLGGNAKLLAIDEDTNQFNADFGVLVRALPFLGFGLAGHNVFASDFENGINRDLTFGIAGFVLDYAQIDFDLTRSFDEEALDAWNFALGAQGMVLGGLVLRGGFYWRQIEMARLYGVGVGWKDHEFGGLGVSFQGDVDNSRNYAVTAYFNVLF